MSEMMQLPETAEGIGVRRSHHYRILAYQLCGVSDLAYIDHGPEASELHQ